MSIKIEQLDSGNGAIQLTEYTQDGKETILFEGTLDECKEALAKIIRDRSKNTLMEWDESSGIIIHDPKAGKIGTTIPTSEFTSDPTTKGN